MRLEKNIHGKKCFLYGNREADRLLIQPVGGHELSVLDKEVQIIREHTNTPFSLAAFLIEDWNRELSPWAAPAVFGKDGFGSGAAETLWYITEKLLPALAESGGMTRFYLGGYSLAGFFALWASFNTDLFCGIAAASPSVWFPGFMEYMEAGDIHAPEVYLSLGDKEEKGNKAMSAVGENIRRTYERLRGANAVTRCTLVWNPGNHFAEPESRTAKGFAWLLNGQEC